jgi:hypothetical protein
MHHQVGIDIGKRGFHFCPFQPDAPLKKLPVTPIVYADDSRWWLTLTNLLAPRAIVAFEPTGWHLAAPIITVLTELTDAEIWLVGHGTTGKVRDTHVSAAKSDEMDARALALIASWIAAGRPPATCRRHNVALEQQVQQLRTLVNDVQRTTKQATRLTNRLHHFAHAIFPALDDKFETWLRLALQGIITPRDIHQLVAGLPENRNRRTTLSIERLAHLLPDIDTPPFAVESIRSTVAELDHQNHRRADLEAHIRAIVTAPPFEEVTRRLMTMPYTGGDPAFIAPFLVACHGRLGEMTADEVKACIGISAKTDTSGSIDKTRAMKGGYAPAGTRLYMWTQTFVSGRAEPNPVRDYYHRLQDRGDKAKPFRAARAKLATIIAHVARDPEGYSYRPLKVVQPEAEEGQAADEA